MEDKIDWRRLRSRIAETPIVVHPKHIKHPNRSPESLGRRKARARERAKERYRENPELHHARYKEWEKANPDKVKAKKKRFYDSHKNDPVWMDNHRRHNREYKARMREKRSMVA